jgi:glycosyltransferase involved in cell wall biosynthesis
VPRKVISIIICSRDRAESLKETLRALGETAVPADMAVEVLVVDNGSRDRTRTVVRQTNLWGRAPRYLVEPRSGTAQARNAGLAEAQGDVLLWLDDDIRPGRSWIEAMCRPILEGRADALAGRIKLPRYLERRWLQAWHRVCLAVDAPTGDTFNLVSANMACNRRVLEKVPFFDTELGGGAMGFCEDTLFSLQLRTAGYVLAAAGDDSTVAHHCGEHRLTSNGLRDVLMRQGRSNAYIDYHWRHRTIFLPTFRGGKSWLGLSGTRILQSLLGNGDPVISCLEARWLWRWAYYDQMTIESHRPRRYARFGLAPLAAEPFAAHSLRKQLAG